jgi:hypothetical protein
VIRFCALVLLASLAVAACDNGTSGSARTAMPQSTTAAPKPTVAATIAVTFPGGQLRVEVADTAEERALGLGGRDSMAEDAGMLFDLGSTRVPTFTMRGMRFPLDMIWIGEDGRIVAVTADVPPEPGVADGGLRRYSPPTAVRYVLEVNAGAAARLGLAAGTLLNFDIPP